MKQLYKMMSKLMKRILRVIPCQARDAMTAFSFLVSFLFLTAQSAEKPSIVDKATLHFDVSDKQSLQLDNDKVVRWNDLNGNGVFRTLRGENARPGLSKDGSAIIFDGQDDYLQLETNQKIMLGDVAVFLVARLLTTDITGKQYLVAPRSKKAKRSRTPKVIDFRGVSFLGERAKWGGIWKFEWRNR